MRLGSLTGRSSTGTGNSPAMEQPELDVDGQRTFAGAQGGR
jgi:hypothetical protein